MNNHLIRRFELELHVSDKESGRMIQDEILLDHKQQLLNEISEKLDKLVGSDEYLTIDSVVIDAGYISLRNFAEQLSQQLAAALEMQLRKLIETARQQPGKAVSLYESDVAGNTVQITVQLKTATYSRQQLLWQLLINGVLPWQGDRNVSIEQLVRELIASGAMHEVLIALQQQGKGNGFLRLAKQLNLKTLLSLFANSEQQQLAEILYKQIALIAGQSAAESFMAAMLQVNISNSAAGSELISALMLDSLHSDYQFRPALAKLIVAVFIKKDLAKLLPDKITQANNSDTIESLSDKIVPLTKTDSFALLLDRIAQLNTIDAFKLISDKIEQLNNSDTIELFSDKVFHLNNNDAFLIRSALLNDNKQADILKNSIEIIKDKLVINNIVKDEDIVKYDNAGKDENTSKDKDVLRSKLESKPESKSESKSGLKSESTPELKSAPKSESDSVILDDSQIITNAGLVILYPFISTFLSRTGHIENREFISDRAREEAAVLLQLLVTGMPDADTLNGE
ncbi:MAG: contractile injection system tape measure protein, partial [Bacteroidia bacterium]